MLVLGIESSCDDTAVALVRNGEEILANCISSQHDLHRLYGGIVPQKAAAGHFERLFPLYDMALAESGVKPSEIDLIAVTRGPGLIGSLMVGLNGAKAIAMALNRPFIGVNHIEAHLYAAMLDALPPFPALGVVLSGGHTLLLLVEGEGRYRLISQTVDDAIGEAFDKAARQLGLPYPGGPHIEKSALLGDSRRYPFKAGQVKGLPLHFSFSGMKTALLYTLRDLEPISEEERFDLAASFQRVAFEDIFTKALRAAKQEGCRSLLFGGGVTCNRSLRLLFQKSDLPQFWPPQELSLDNAAMIAGLGYRLYQSQGRGDALDLEADPRLSFERGAS